MKQGKQTCQILKEIRRKIAQANNISYTTKECGHKGNCTGTCPTCEQEMRYLEEQLQNRSRNGKPIILLGLSLSLAALCCTTSCTQNDQQNDKKTLNDLKEELKTNEPFLMGEPEVYRIQDDTDTNANTQPINEDSLSFQKRKDNSN